jgi:hypothetical protein
MLECGRALNRFLSLLAREEIWIILRFEIQFKFRCATKPADI